MRSVKLAELAKNPSKTVRTARRTPVVVTIGDRPEAILFHLAGDNLLTTAKMRLAVVTALYIDGHLPVDAAARAVTMPLARFMKHLGRSGIPAITGSAADAAQDLDVLRKWTASS
jgi:hypothetical protein